MKGLRGTALDVFGYARVRREERALIAEYRALIERALARLSPATHDTAVALGDLPDVIRGYEHIKLDNVRLFRARAAELAARLG
jgi:indolepyruvate ferredoxin oxidoreductase